MNIPIVIFHHGLFFLGEPPRLLPAAVDIATEQVQLLKASGLWDAASEIHVGINGGIESEPLATSRFPEKANIVYHGLACRNEIRTILMIEKWVREHDDEAYILYEHQKGSTHPVGHELSTRWRRCMQRHLVTNWRQCVRDLETVESVGCHWMEPPATPATQYIWAGNFWWARNSFLKTLPSIMERARLKESGIDALESRYEAEVWIGNGPRPPTHIDYHGPNWTPAKIHTCEAGLQRYGVRRKVLT